MINLLTLPKLNSKDFNDLCCCIGVDRYGIERMILKSSVIPFKIGPLKSQACIILKQALLAYGGEAAISSLAITETLNNLFVITLATEKQYQMAISSIRDQQFSLQKVAHIIEKALHDLKKSVWDLKLRDGRILEIGRKPVIMGILNLTPDSFSNDGRLNDFDAAISQALKMEEDGADIIDIGGESTRPNATPITAEEEWRRVEPVLVDLRKKTSLPISIDTYKIEVAEKAFANGADILNDITGLRNPALRKFMADNGLPFIVMHMRGMPQSMQSMTDYDNLLLDMHIFFEKRLEEIISSGISINQIIIDPGIGFSKTTEQNLTIIKGLNVFKSFGLPILVGSSRKSFIGKITDADVDNRLAGSITSSVMAYMNGASILRVHDVKETNQALKVAFEIVNAPLI
ncbi:MAG: dihydropteroate synthase [Candidatus Coatesbacteria bacterium]|nr:dihydropteroate synthase [Candidatus Coatesbacteria bacterium]